MAIVALLVSMAVIETAKFRRQANESTCQANLKAIASGFEVYAARNALSYAPEEQTNLQFLVDSGCLNQDLTAMPQLGNFRYTVAEVGPAGYDIRAIALNSALAAHNYQVITGGTLKRTDSPDPSDSDFKTF